MVNGKKTAMFALAFAYAGLIVWVACQIASGAASHATVILCALLICAILTGVLVLSRRLPAAVRKQGLKHAAVIGLLLVVAFLAYSWRQGEFRDALFFLPFTLLGVLLALGPLFALSWGASSLILGRTRSQTRATNSSGSFSRFRLAGRLFTVAVAACLFIFLLIPWMRVLSAVDLARATRMKSRGRGMWVALTAWSDDREAAGRPLLWPHDLGFTGSEASTDYFRRLFSDEAGQMAAQLADRLVPDLMVSCLRGPGLPEAASAEAFGPENNAWQVVCIGEDADTRAPFLITRNVDFGDTLTPTSQVRVIRSGPLTLRRVVWITRGGGCYDVPFHRFKPRVLFKAEYETFDPDAPPPVYRVMRP